MEAGRADGVALPGGGVPAVAEGEAEACVASVVALASRVAEADGVGVGVRVGAPPPVGCADGVGDGGTPTNRVPVMPLARSDPTDE